MAEIIWAPRALDDLVALIEHISKDAPMAARRFAQKIVRRVELLKMQPVIGNLIAEDDTETYREILQGNYRVIYRSEPEQIIIVAVYHAAKLLDAADLD
jgi:toxin ParE1/3/4